MNIPTAEEFLENYRFKAGEHIGNSDYDLMAKYAIEFAKLHVEAALKQVKEKAFAQSTSSNMTSKDNHHTLTCVHLGKIYVNEKSILNAYPLDNIK